MVIDRIWITKNETAPPMTRESKSYPIPEFSIPSLGLQHHLADLAEMQVFLQSRGINTRNTRIERYIRYLEQAAQGEQPDVSRIFKNVTDSRFQSSLDWGLYLLREAHELMWIFRGLKIHVPKGADEKLRKIVGGSDFAALDGHTESRNTQFEMRMASYFCQTGWRVDLSTNTDIIATSEASEFAFYVECKRIAAPRGIQENLLKAKSQLIERIPYKKDRYKVYGLIAADVTRAAFSHNGITLGVTNDHSRDVVQDKLSEIADKAELIPGLLESFPEFLGCCLQIHIPALIYHPPTTATRFSSTLISNQGLDEDAQCASLLFELILKNGASSDPRESPPERMERRTGVTLPAGTVFSFDTKVLEMLLAGSDSNERPKDDVIAAITIESVKHEFSLSDLGMLPKKLLANICHDPGQEPKQAALTLILEMYLRRFPYLGPNTQR